VQRRGGQQRHVLRQPELPGTVERRGRVFAARQESVQRHQPDTFGLRQLQSGEYARGRRRRVDATSPLLVALYLDGPRPTNSLLPFSLRRDVRLTSRCSDSSDFFVRFPRRSVVAT